MNRITDVTRQDIIDIIRDGVWIPFDVPQFDSDSGTWIDGHTIWIPVYGRLTELDFLERLYDLDHMPSRDSRFTNARDDIWQHTVNNNDWDDFWYFSDGRFNLSKGGDDSYLLHFICEMLHPAVRDEKTQWKTYLEKFNELLKPDGYRIVPVRKISGRDVFEPQEIDQIVITHSPEKLYAGLKLIGEGSYAKVFRYSDEFYQRGFALKRANPDLNEKELERFRREFETMHKLNSPYVVEVYAYNDERNEYTMELMDLTLEKYIDTNNSTMSIDTRRSIVTQLLRAYEYLHSQFIYHRDISFKNVLLKQYDDALIVKVSDFGLVKIEDSDLTSENTDFKGALNDPALKIDGFDSYDFLHEIYAITLLFAYILTGKRNWAKITDPTIKSFIQKGTNADKSKRFQSMEEIEKAVRACLAAMDTNTYCF